MDTYLTIIEKADRNYSLYALDVPGRITTGKIVEETINHMHDALRSFSAGGACPP
jgi:predicted RNase H-like HicB family nuclease